MRAKDQRVRSGARRRGAGRGGPDAAGLQATQLPPLGRDPPQVCRAGLDPARPTEARPRAWHTCARVVHARGEQDRACPAAPLARAATLSYATVPIVMHTRGRKARPARRPAVPPVWVLNKVRPARRGSTARNLYHLVLGTAACIAANGQVRARADVRGPGAPARQVLQHVLF